MVPNVRINFSTSSEGGIRRLACIPRTLEEVSLEVEVTFLMKRILGLCSWRLIVYVEGYVVSDIEEPLRVLTLLLTMIMIIATIPSPGLLPMIPFRVIRIVIIGSKRRVHLARIWAMTLWAGL